jgi:hypothetical protein
MGCINANRSRTSLHEGIHNDMADSDMEGLPGDLNRVRES